MRLTTQLAAVLPHLVVLSYSQQIGTLVPEVHPKLTTQVCTRAGGCVSRQTSLVTDALSRFFHAVGEPSVSCNPVNATLCPDAATCARSCALEGVEYGSIGVLTKGSALTMRQFLPNGQGLQAVSPRVSLLAEDDENYELLKLVNQEFSFDVDVSQLGCGMNGALYLSEMEASGVRSDSNPAGAAYGTGYCDAQCFNTTWINGMPNLNSSGACCNEMDIWEANSLATATTPHPCNEAGSFTCEGAACGRTNAGACDKDGCGLNPFGAGVKNFYGPGMTVDTRSPFTVVTQFLTSDNSSAGTLSEIRRMYIQNGTVVQQSPATQGPQLEAISTIDQNFCSAKNASSFERLGGLETMGASLQRGMVLLFSIWTSQGDFMNWLDSGSAGPCSNISGNPETIMAENPDASVTFSNIRWGEIGSTFNTSTTIGSGAAVLDAQASALEAGRVTSNAVVRLPLAHGLLVAIAITFMKLLL
ncbi:hypothetical protein JX265_012821 [Neoarthrinium moseri]|uniref:Glucanase n=1 Tax=Neoarthrinium moseri TaxID=1658444 RepID=A0A9P9W9R6_9PEZI|nr:hypothetical protein JX265_012821 [Neoarthrinium moseri]